MWYPFFIVGGMAWWVCSIFCFCALMACVEEESGSMAISCVILYLLIVHIFGNADIWGYITGNWYKFLTYLVLYAVIGIVWSIAKLRFSVKSIKRKIQLIQLKHPDKKGSDLDSHLYSGLSRTEYRRMKFEGCASDVLFWMSYWPASALWTLIDDPIKRFFVWVYDALLVGLFKRVHDSAMGGVLEDDNDAPKT